eukprot:GHVH01011344.1.p1 GENE.GHVH01011344.1~~GHVH01011344.1.p1  ORF type:complete len:452 (+),score=65.97 GHVH01011344.1:568-1923(+)
MDVPADDSNEREGLYEDLDSVPNASSLTPWHQVIADEYQLLDLPYGAIENETNLGDNLHSNASSIGASVVDRSSDDMCLVNDSQLVYELSKRRGVLKGVQFDRRIRAFRTSYTSYCGRRYFKSYNVNSLGVKHAMNKALETRGKWINQGRVNTPISKLLKYLSLVRTFGFVPSYLVFDTKGVEIEDEAFGDSPLSSHELGDGCGVIDWFHRALMLRIERRMREREDSSQIMYDCDFEFSCDSDDSTSRNVIFLFDDERIRLEAIVDRKIRQLTNEDDSNRLRKRKDPTGIRKCRATYSNTVFYRSTYTPPNTRKQKTKTFSEAIYGKDALEEAILQRLQWIVDNNENNLMYSGQFSWLPNLPGLNGFNGILMGLDFCKIVRDQLSRRLHDRHNMDVEKRVSWQSQRVHMLRTNEISRISLRNPPPSTNSLQLSLAVIDRLSEKTTPSRTPN